MSNDNEMVSAKAFAQTVEKLQGQLDECKKTLARIKKYHYSQRELKKRGLKK
jgi:hypothetical protein